MKRTLKAGLGWAFLATAVNMVVGGIACGQLPGTGRLASPAGPGPFADEGPAVGPAYRYGGGDFFGDSACGGNCHPGGTVLQHGDVAFDDVDPGGILCGDEICCDPCGRRFSAGVDFTFVKPHFESNLAYTLLESDGVRSDTFTEQEFNFGTELAPRIWLEMLQCGNLGLRASWWQFDNSAGMASASPPANGFGRISSPDFGQVDLSTSVPNSTYSARANLHAYNVDLEGTNAFQCGDWGWMATAGLRYASIEQTYNSTLTSATNATQGTINYIHEIRGIGPTMSLRTQRPLTPQLALFGMARGSLLFGDSTSRLNAIEDQDLDTPLNTQRQTSRDDLLPVADVQVGLQYTPMTMGCLNPYVHFALEGQAWGGAGNASSETGSLGFYGFNFAFGFDW